MRSMLYDFIHGRLVSIAFIVFALGLIYQFILFFRLTRKKEWFYPPAELIRENKKSPGERFICLFASLKGTLWKTDPLMAAVTSVFHTFLFLTPVFLLGHNILLDQFWGLSFWSLPESVADFSAVVLLICAAFFLGRRLFLARVRVITTFYDYLVLWLAAAPFLTGYLAYHQCFGYRAIMTAHVLTGEVLLITIPFTKLGHMLFFFLYRFLIGSEYSLARGERTW